MKIFFYKKAQKHSKSSVFVDNRSIISLYFYDFVQSLCQNKEEQDRREQLQNLELVQIPFIMQSFCCFLYQLFHIGVLTFVFKHIQI